MPSHLRAIIVITEGASSDLLDLWCAEGRLPNFQALRDTGSSGSLAGEQVPYEPPGLHTAFTGTPPGEHGWYSYWSVHPNDYQPRVLNSGDVSMPLLWHRPETASLRFAVINVCGTHPPQALNGYLVSYPMRQTLRASHPQELLRQLLRQDGIRTVHDVAVWYSGQAREDFLQGVLLADASRAQTAMRLLDKGVNVLILNLTAIDRVCHFYWQEIEPGSPLTLTETAVFRAYASCDAILGRLLRRRRHGTHLLAFSEIGFGPLRAYLSLNATLAGAKLLSRASTGNHCTILPSGTVAFEAVQGCHGVNINLAGRYAEGIVSEADYDVVREQVREALLDAINPYTGLPALRRVLRREELYSGRALEAAPDLVVEPADERYQPLGDPFWATKVNRTLQSGWHRRESYWAGVGPLFPTATGRRATPLDVAPTIYRMLGIEPAVDWPGKSLTEAA